MTRSTSILHRDDPSREPLTGHVKVTREDWLNAARDVLAVEGVTAVKVLSLADRMDVSRSSFYWYFKNRKDLLTALLDDWEIRNTEPIIRQCAAPSANITAACCNFFRCFVDPDQFDRSFDFAVRDWARTDQTIRIRIENADGKRLTAIIAMFRRHDYEVSDADARARVLYYMQLGYHALEVREPMDLRMSRLDGYLACFTGRPVDPVAVADFVEFALPFGHTE